MSTALATSGIRVTVDELVRLHGEARLINLAPRHVRTRAHSGSHLTTLRGRGMEFAEVRPYAPGDDIRHIDWRVTARTQHTVTKLFREERERPVSLIVDQSATMRFGTRVAFKSVVAARAAALLAWAAADQGDRVGGIVLHERQVAEMRPRRGQAAVLALLRALTTEPHHLSGEPTDWNAALQRAVRLNRPGTLWIVVSDFYAPGEQSLRLLTELRRHSDVMLIQVYDAIESDPPPPGRYGFSDGRRFVALDLNGESTRRSYQQPFLARRRFLEDTARRLHCPLLQLATHEPIAATLSRRLTATQAAERAR